MYTIKLNNLIKNDADYLKDYSSYLFISLVRSPSGDAVAISKSGGENPWTKRIAMAASPPPAAINFSAILKDEKEKSETLVRTQQKPLALIQVGQTCHTDWGSNF